MQKYYVLWTGGWDSTFMLIKLLSNNMLEGGGIIPVYILDPGRKSHEYELKAMREIHSLLSARDFPNKLEDMIVVKKEEIPADKSLTLSAKALNAKYGLGSQYDWLSRYAKSTGIKLHLGIEAGPRSIALRCFQEEGLCLVDTLSGKVVISSGEVDDLSNLFSYFVLPILDDTEISMRDYAIANGFDDVMSHIWFCHDPINSQPCGLCNPCLEKYGSGMGYLLPSKAIHRVKILLWIEHVLGVRARKNCAAVLRRFIVLQ